MWIGTDFTGRMCAPRAISSADWLTSRFAMGFTNDDADALAIEGPHEAEARGRQADAPAGRGNKDGRRQRFLRSKQG